MKKLAKDFLAKFVFRSPDAKSQVRGHMVWHEHTSIVHM